MTVWKRPKSFLLLRLFQRASGRQLFVVAQEACLLVDQYVQRKTSTSSPHYCQFFGKLILALGELVVPQCIWVSLVKLPEFLQTTY